jgi:4a-hydroxytetrahydrobiopterin dehydratase
MNNVCLIDKHCKPCEGGVPPLSQEEVTRLSSELKLEWNVTEGKKISHLFKFKDFVQAIAFVNAIVPLAEQEGHHPDIQISYNKVTIDLWTHAIGGLSENDFILASKIEALDLAKA